MLLLLLFGDTIVAVSSSEQQIGGSRLARMLRVALRHAARVEAHQLVGRRRLVLQRLDGLLLLVVLLLVVLARGRGRRRRRQEVVLRVVELVLLLLVGERGRARARRRNR